MNMKKKITKPEHQLMVIYPATLWPSGDKKIEKILRRKYSNSSGMGFGKFFTFFKNLLSCNPAFNKRN